MAAPSRQLYSMQEVIDLTGISEDSIRREMKKGLASRFMAGRRRFLRGDVEEWFKIGDAVPTAPVKSFTRSRVTEDASEIPATMLPTWRRAAG